MSAQPPPPGPPSGPAGNTPPGSGDQPPSSGWGTSPPPPPPASEAPGGWAAPAPGGPGAPTPHAGRRPGELLDRFLARLIDHILVGVVVAIIVSVIVIGTLLGSDGNLYGGYGDNILAGILSAVLSTAISMGYFVYMESQQGRTLGKMLMNLRVEGAGGGNPTPTESVKRNIWMALPLLGIVPVIGGLVGSLAQLVAVILIAVGISNDQARRQPWTDKFAGTQVLKEG